MLKHLGFILGMLIGFVLMGICHTGPVDNGIVMMYMAPPMILGTLIDNWWGNRK